MMKELTTGLWRWTTPHPDWKPEEDSLDANYREVACLAFRAPGAFVLIDPLAPPTGTPLETAFWAELDALVAAAELPVEAVLTIFWHERSLQAVCERYGAGAWVPAGAAERVTYRPVAEFSPGSVLGGGVHTRPTSRPGEVVLWLPQPRALVFGDVILGTAEGRLRLCPADWIDDAADLETLRRDLLPLLDLRPELVLPAHGAPVFREGHAALAAALG